MASPLRLDGRGGVVVSYRAKYFSKARESAPTVAGADIEVPHLSVYPSKFDVEVDQISLPPISQPGAITSGLTRLSKVGPRELKYEMSSLFESVEPTLSAFLAGE